MGSFVKTIVALSVLCGAAVVSAQPQQQKYYTGSGGKEIRIAVLEPVGNGLSAEEQWMLPLVQGTITGDLGKFSAMTVVDRQNVDKGLAQAAEYMASGHYDEKDMVKIGNFTTANHILTGSISKTPNAFMLELTVMDIQSGVRKASYSPTPVSPIALENLSALKAASEDLLGQLGVELTDAARSELTQVVNTSRIQAETMLARGIAAQKQGTEIAALSYFFQAAAFDSSLFEASKRSSVMAASISSGNIGADVRNDIVWRESWVARLKETENTYHSIISSVDPPYTLFYSTGITQGTVNYEKKTIDLSIRTNLSANLSWFNAMDRSLQAVQAVLNGLNATNRKDVWKLSRWPWNGVSQTNPFASYTYKQYDITVVFELVNERGRAIGSQTVRLTPHFRFTDNNDKVTIEFTENSPGTISFNGVNAYDISDKMTVRVATVNGAPPQNARFAIRAISEEKRREYSFLRIERGIVKGFNNALSAEQRARFSNLVVPGEVWEQPVTAIGKEAFVNSELTGVSIPGSVAAIGDKAFSNNRIINVNISNGVTAIGDMAFEKNHITAIVIPNSVRTIGEDAFDVAVRRLTVGENVVFYGQKWLGFVSTYRNKFKGRAGTYTYTPGSGWDKIDKTEEEKNEERVANMRREEEERVAKVKREEEERVAEVIREETERVMSSLVWWFALGGSADLNTINDHFGSEGFLISGGFVGPITKMGVLRFGLNLDFGFSALSDEAFERKCPDGICGKDSSKIVGFWKGGGVLRLYPVKAFYLSGGVNYGVYWNGEVVFPIGVGLVIGRKGRGLLLDAQYNIMMPKNGDRGYLAFTVGFVLGLGETLNTR